MMKVRAVNAMAKLIPTVGSMFAHHSGEFDEKARAPNEVRIEKAGR